MVYLSVGIMNPGSFDRLVNYYYFIVTRAVSE